MKFLIFKQIHILSWELEKSNRSNNLFDLLNIARSIVLYIDYPTYLHILCYVFYGFLHF